MTKKNIQLLILFVLTGCGTTLTGYEFKTTASYVAINSNFKVNVIVQGRVPANEDLGDGDVSGTIVFNEPFDTIYFQTHSTTLTNIKYKGLPFEITDSTNFTKTFIALFEIIGFRGYNQNEIDEIEKIIKATTYGPKGTYLEGQTKIIKVDKVEFERK